MKLTMKNIGVIRDAEIELNGITVLTGLNGTGKSTTSKALYGVIAPYVNLSEKITNERTDSVRHIISYDLIAVLYEQGTLFDTPKDVLCSALANKRLPIPERYEEWVQLFPQLLKGKDSTLEKEVFPKFLEKLKRAVNRPDMDYVQYLLNGTIRWVFDEQINTIGSSSPGEIALKAEQETQIAWMKIAENKVVACSGEEIHTIQPIYIEPLHVLNGLNRNQSEVPYTSELHDFLKGFGNSGRGKTFEEHESRERVLSFISSIIHGRLARSAFGEFVFKDEHFNETISLRNVASGNKIFAVLQDLTEQGALRENTVLIIDEPESNQHPEWQLKLAEALVLIRRELGVRIFLTTHSPYFLRGIEVYADEYELSGHCHYYQTQPTDDAATLFRIQNVDGNTDSIYRAFYMPFEEL